MKKYLLNLGKISIKVEKNKRNASFLKIIFQKRDFCHYVNKI